MNQPDFESLLRDAIGLDVTTIGSNTLERVVKSRMENLGIAQSQCYWEYVQGSPSELQELIELVIVPETWFFRDREAFSAMIRLIAQPWLTFQVGLPLRILSVPCCSGEEPYSIAIALVEAGFASARIQVDAVDVSSQALTRARRGAYGSNSFRGEDLGFRDRYFERSGSVYTIPQWLRGLVSFHQENLFSPSFRLSTAPYDIIFCRNVLIYFDRAKQDTAMATLNRLLKDDGHLFVGPAETILASRSGFRPVNETMSFAFFKGNRVSLATQSPLQPPLKVAPKASLPTPLKKSAAAATEILAPPKLAPNTSKTIVSDIEHIKHLADIGHLDEAAILCEKYLDQEGQAAEVYHLLALISDAKGESDRAMDCYRKVLYLEPAHSDALTHLALLYERKGNSASAKRLRDRAHRSEVSGGHTKSSGETASRSGQ